MCKESVIRSDNVNAIKLVDKLYSNSWRITSERGKSKNSFIAILFTDSAAIWNQKKKKKNRLKTSLEIFHS